MPTSFMDYDGLQGDEEANLLDNSLSNKSTKKLTDPSGSESELSDLDDLDYFRSNQEEMETAALEKLIKNRNGKPGIPSFSSKNLASLLSGNGALPKERGSIDSKNGGSNLLGLGSSGYGSDFGYESIGYGTEVGHQAYGPSTQCLNGLNPLLLLLTGALALAGYYFMYTRLTAIGGRKKREDESLHVHELMLRSVFHGGYSNIWTKNYNSTARK